MRALSCILLSGVACTALAQDVEVPHIFQAGAPARAAEVNANFDALVAAINANQGAIQGLQGAVFKQIGTFSISGAPYNDAAIPVFLFQWDSTYDLAGGGGGGGGAGSATFGGITVGRPPDGFSPQLFLDFAAGKIFPEAKIQLTSADSTVTSYVLTDLQIAGHGAVTSGGAGVLETITFSGYQTLTISTDAAGSPNPAACFNIASSVSC